jgi:hypothetical protein
MPDWRVLSVRLTVFVTPDTEVPVTLWRDVVGEDPENSVTQRATATRTETGPFSDGVLTLQVQPMRIDWTHEPVGLGSQGGLPQVLGPFPNGAEPFLRFARRWITNGWYPPTTRMALGFVLISATPDRDAGYRELSQYIDGVPNTPDATDFLYQVNRPRASRVGLDGLQVNRLSKWSVGAFRLIAVLAGAANANPILSPMHHHLRLELDINTGADFPGKFPRQSVGAVLDDLVNGATEIFEHGNRIR